MSSRSVPTEAVDADEPGEGRAELFMVGIEETAGDGPSSMVISSSAGVSLTSSMGFFRFPPGTSGVVTSCLVRDLVRCFV